MITESISNITGQSLLDLQKQAKSVLSAEHAKNAT
jgi:hypothetical protein